MTYKQVPSAAFAPTSIVVRAHPLVNTQPAEIAATQPMLYTTDFTVIFTWRFGQVTDSKESAAADERNG